MNIDNCLWEKYCRETEYSEGSGRIDEKQFREYISGQSEGLQRIQIREKEETGLLYYDACLTPDAYLVTVPVYGCCAESEKMAVRLFQRLAEKTVNETPRDRTCDFSVRLYAHDTECIRAFHMMEFGNMAERGTRRIEKAKAETGAGIKIRALNKREIRSQWDALWSATSNIIGHLRKSPVFYPGREFTEEVYRDFYFSEDTEVIAAYSGQKLAGMIEWNLEEDGLMFPPGKSVNVGEVYVIPELRGTGLAAALLRTAENRAADAGYEFMWVEHGTANPNARGFWNRYFDTYQYELVRSIKPVL